MRLMRRRRIVKMCLLAFGLLGAPSLMSQTFPPRPGQHDFILDQAGLMQPEDAQQIKSVCDRLLSEERIPIVVVTIPSLAQYDGADIESYARALFNSWGIGSQTRNYGILLLVSLGDGKARIELGAGWADTKDDTARMVMDDIIVPNFKKGSFSEGILQGVRALDTMARGQTVQKPVAWGPLLVVVGLVLLGVGAGISLIRSGHQGWGWALLAAIFALIVGLLAIASHLPSGESFGGGSSDGGGATGSW
jgi:uncharacterized protein